jgi:hypothetical protein
LVPNEVVDRIAHTVKVTELDPALESMLRMRTAWVMKSSSLLQHAKSPVCGFKMFAVCLRIDDRLGDKGFGSCCTGAVYDAADHFILKNFLARAP